MTSKLSHMESWRFCRAIYRLWLYSFAFHAPEEEGGDHTLAGRKHKFLSQFPTVELFELNSVAQFLVDVCHWVIELGGLGCSYHLLYFLFCFAPYGLNSDRR